MTGAKSLILFLITFLLLSPLNGRGDVIAPDSLISLKGSKQIPDSLLHSHDSIPTKSENWLKQLTHNNFNFKDTTISYPKFMDFVVKVYNWGDEFFNGTDPSYIQGTGKRWKVFVKSDNWVDSYYMDFSHNKMRMMSDIYTNLGAYIQYMAVSIGYALDMSNIICNKPMNHKKFEIGFNCQRFDIKAFYNENTGGTYLRTFGDYKNGHLFKKEFPGLQLHQYGINAYYFFNNKKYSNGAAYSFSRIQRKDAGSFIAGFSYSNIGIDLDFTQLPYPLKFYIHGPLEKYRFHYDSYNIVLGYGYNFVFKRNFLLNLTALPTIGINYTREDSQEMFLRLLSLGAKAKFALVYNYQDIFCSLNGSFDGNWYRSANHTLFSSIEDFAIVLGVRF